MKTSARILLASALVLQLTSCGEDKTHVDIQNQLRSGEAFVTGILTQTLAGHGDSITADFSGDMTKEAYLQWIRSLESSVGTFQEVDMVSAKWNPAEFAADSSDENANAINSTDNVRVVAVLMSGESSGATLNVYLQPQGSSWNIIGMDAESTGAVGIDTISQAD